MANNTTDGLKPEKRLKIPKVNIKSVLKQKDKLLSKLGEFTGRRLEKDTFFEVISLLHQNLPDLILRETIQESLKGWLKQELTPEVIDDIAWKLAGNISQLQNHSPVTAWNGQKSAEWILTEITEVRAVRFRNELGCQLTFQALVGGYTPNSLVQVWSLKRLSYLATYKDTEGRGFGFGRSRVSKAGNQRGTHLFQNMHQFYGLRCFLLFSPSNKNKDIFVSEVGHSTATMTYNRQKIKLRDRAQTACLKKLPVAIECYRCPYGKDRCEAATHSKTFTRGDCPRCAKSNCLFDPSDTDHLNVCIDCANKERRT